MSQGEQHPINVAAKTMTCKECYWCQQCGACADEAPSCDDFTPIYEDIRAEQAYHDTLKENSITYASIISSLQ